jgi:hypothetical protein
MSSSSWSLLPSSSSSSTLSSLIFSIFTLTTELTLCLSGLSTGSPSLVGKKARCHFVSRLILPGIDGLTSFMAVSKTLLDGLRAGTFLPKSGSDSSTTESLENLQLRRWPRPRCVVQILDHRRFLHRFHLQCQQLRSLSHSPPYQIDLEIGSEPLSHVSDVELRCSPFFAGSVFFVAFPLEGFKRTARYSERHVSASK